MIDAKDKLIKELRGAQERSETVIKILQREAAHSRTQLASEVEKRKMLWTWMRDIQPLLHQIGCEDAESEEILNSAILRIGDVATLLEDYEFLDPADRI